MLWYQSLILALIQAITEFLPVSSSGHLAIAQELFGSTPSLSFDIFLNTATLFSVIFFFKKQSKDFLNKLVFIFLSSIPAVLVTLIFKDQISSLFSQTTYLTASFLVTSLLLFSVKLIKKRKQTFLTPQKAIIIGLFQSLAIFPGISRSASTIFAGLLCGLGSQKAFEYSFYLFIPASLGALVFGVTQTDLASLSFSSYLPYAIICFLVGLISLKLLKKTIQSKKLWYFSFYTLALSCLTIYFSYHQSF
ncbi:undecaprenyl-diphosphate phosphatase [Patescibacteria group bacterium]|nr:undecaprenyl-diphosphate phosphatase [Patescibacteria group bacterium]MCG2702423.1 undecaprenyl-diphosphate phosphatase [Candidatus Parcubacteria bacterium]MBU4264527.1 undecaprenyl-diphosphate phosphatase [Patescibacteria group bacterium]MBU4390458.1 undecaprenyl-diphosphate phosphatase [Patescibacteria group bacterium]MBU4397374.1 undecaprenyl-diphosphate phosphatase [Patescibacteria group bacterium]